MDPTEIEELETLKKKCLKKDGKPKARVHGYDLERLNELRTQYDAEHTATFRDDARIEGATKEIVLNVCGSQVLKTVPK